MVTWRDVMSTDKRICLKKDIPVYEEMLLEAYKANLDHEYNKTILFSIIAVESLLAHTFDKQYELEKNKRNYRKGMRIIENNDGSRKDPILKSLLTDRTDFKKLLHEIPLYLLKRSILIENQILYNNLLKLYNTN
jgi:hypothetical protein